MHGTDVFNSLINFFSKQKISGIDMKFNGIIEKNLLLVEGWKHSDKKVDLTIFNGTEQKRYQLIERSSSIYCETQYDETLIIRGSKLHKKSITSKVGNEYSFIENVIPLNKTLMNALFPENKGKWYFTRLVLNIIPEGVKSKNMKLTFIRNFGLRLIKTKINIDGVDVGDVYFSLVKNK